MIIQEPNGRNILNVSDLTMLLLAREQYGRRRKKGILYYERRSNANP